MFLDFAERSESLSTRVVNKVSKNKFGVHDEMANMPFAESFKINHL